MEFISSVNQGPTQIRRTDTIKRRSNNVHILVTAKVRANKNMVTVYQNGLTENMVDEL